MIKKLSYKQLNFKDLTINFAKSRCRTMHITIKQDGNIFYVVPYGVKEDEAIKFLDERYDWIKKSLVKMKEKASDDDGNNILLDTKRLNKEEKKALLIKIGEYVEKYENLLKVSVNKYSLRLMRTMWGSCSFKTRNIRFNEKLYYKNDRFIEYIVLHELTHIIVPNHSKRFYNIIKKYMPDYKAVLKM